MAVKPPVGLVERPEDLFRRTHREAAFYISIFLRQYVVQFSICLLIILLHIAVLATPLFERFEYIFLDFFFRHRPILQTHPGIAYIEVAEDGVQSLGRWPWPRSYHAVMTHLLTEWKAKAIVFDVIFSERSAEFEDGALIESFQKADNVYLSGALEQKGKEKIWIHSLPDLEKYAKGVGHINIKPDRDGTLRRIHPYVENDGKDYPHLALLVAHDFLNERGKLPDWKKKDELLINWAGKWDEAFHHYSYVDLLKSFELSQKGEKPLISKEEIEGKICLIGVTAFGHSDIKATPMEPAYPGVGVHANVINGILTKQFIRSVSFSTNIICLVLVGLCATGFFVAFRSVGSFIAGLSIGFIWILLSYILFRYQGIWVYVMHPLVLILTLYVFSTVYVLILRNAERLKLFKLATRDGLTGLYVIRHFRILMNEVVKVAKKRKKPVSIILGDIDHFKNINDTYGHACGDMVLKGVAEVVQATIGDGTQKDENISARYGGEEFIVMLKNCNLQDAAFKVAEAIRKAIENREFVWEGKKVNVTISLGVSTLRFHENVPDIMVHRADAALYRAKDTGRNRVCLEEAV